MQSFYIFDDKSINLHSPAFYLGADSVLILRAFGFSKNKEVPEPGEGKKPQRAIVEMILNKDGSTPRGDACQAKLELKEAEIIFAEDVTQCGMWNLNACQNLVILAVQGTYRLRFNDQGAVGKVVIHGTFLRRDEISHYLPHDLFLGVQSNG